MTMISVILYGRNDAHGYNLHRRAALSLNCLAEVLTDSEDEILFVDYNTPDELPTFVEALSDTLTERCLGLLRVIRVPALLHEQRFAARTHLAVVEPVARNVAARRAKDANRWLLSTNTDMVFLPLGGSSLSDVCGDLDDGFYSLPRFELPEWLWEQVPRSDPGRAMAEIRRFGPGLRLDEHTVSHEWVRFDAPGDFQLILRDDFFAVDGFDEEMLLGWHVDSNMSRRMGMYRGSIMSLDELLAGYHCNHNRIPTVYHGTEGIANDLDRFFYSVERVELPAQRATWGLADADLEEVRILTRAGAVAATVMQAIPDDASARAPSDAAEAAFALSYDSGHVLPFIADSLVVSSSEATIGYVGVNHVLERMLSSLVVQLGLGSLTVADLEDTRSLEELVGLADVIVVDLGVDKSVADLPPSDADGHASFRLPAGLDLVFAAFERLIELERARLERGQHPRRIVLVNSSAVLWDAYVLANLVCSHTTTHSRVRRATVKRLPVDDEAAQEARLRQRRLVRWAARPAGQGRLALRAGEPVELGHLSDYRGFGEGWAYPDEEGIWTQGQRSELAIALEGIEESDYLLVLSLASVCVGPDESLTVDLLVNGEGVATRDFSQRDPGLTWVIELPANALAASEADLTFEIAEPRSPLEVGWSGDDRPLGIFIGGVTLEPANRSLVLGESVDFIEGSGAERLLGEGWSALEPSGVWTVGERASLVLTVPAAKRPVELVLSVVAFVTASHPELEVEASAVQGKLAGRLFRYGDAESLLRVPLRAAVGEGANRTVVDLRMSNPVAPADLGLSDDARRLGLHLRSLTIRECGRLATLRHAISHASLLTRARLWRGGSSVLRTRG